MSADRTDRSEDGGSQAERAVASRREIACDSTISCISKPAREVRVSVAPDFRLHPSSEIGSLPFCQLGRTKWLRTDPSKIPLLQTHINCKNRLPQYIPTTLAGLWGLVINLVIRYGGIRRNDIYLSVTLGLGLEYRPTSTTRCPRPTVVFVSTFIVFIKIGFCSSGETIFDISIHIA